MAFRHAAGDQPALLQAQLQLMRALTSAASGGIVRALSK
jgi:hypothetical protein